MTTKPASVHQNHRMRMRERVLQYGYDSFSDHEILEMFLYVANARGDTNETAHRLIEHFGSFDAVMEADQDELLEIPGVGPQAAFYITLGMEMVRRCARSRMSEPLVYETVQQIAESMWSYFFGLNHERLYMLLFDNRMALISRICLSDGTVNSTAVPRREMMEAILKKHASRVVLVHNHPHGVARPSDEDIQVTAEIAEMLRSIGVPLVEHLIITDTCFKSIMKEHYLFKNVMAGMAREKVGDNIVDRDRFYNVDEETFRFSMLKNLQK